MIFKNINKELLTFIGNIEKAPRILDGAFTQTGDDCSQNSCNACTINDTNGSGCC